MSDLVYIDADKRPRKGVAKTLVAVLFTPKGDRIDLNLWANHVLTVTLNDGNWFFGSLEPEDQTAVRRAMSTHGIAERKPLGLL